MPPPPSSLGSRRAGTATARRHHLETVDWRSAGRSPTPYASPGLRAIPNHSSCKRQTEGRPYALSPRPPVTGSRMGGCSIAAAHRGWRASAGPRQGNHPTKTSLALGDIVDPASPDAHPQTRPEGQPYLHGWPRVRQDGPPRRAHQIPPATPAANATAPRPRRPETEPRPHPKARPPTTRPQTGALLPLVLVRAGRSRYPPYLGGVPLSTTWGRVR